MRVPLTVLCVLWLAITTPAVGVDTTGPALADASESERDAIERLRHGDAWVRRAIAAERLARYDCEGSEVYLRDLAADPHWAVRSFAILACGRRGLDLAASLFAQEREPRVLRTALRARYDGAAEPARLLVERIEASPSLADKLLALEMSLLLPPQPRGRGSRPIDHEELLRTIIFRMDRVEAGTLSPRLAAITSGHDSGRSYRWREWYRKNRRDLGLHGGYLVEADPIERSRGAIAALAPERFVQFEGHVRDLADRSIELAIVLDCTASMSGELAECQGGVDALMLFARGVARDVRLATICYRDRRDAWETRAWDFTSALDEARTRLWQLSAEGGGDSPESVHAGLRVAYERLSWTPPQDPALPPSVLQRVVLIGDGPPHPGTGDQCVARAGVARQRGIVTYAIQPRAEVTPRVIDGADEGDESDERESPAEPDPELRKWDRPGLAPWFGPPRGRTSPWRKKLQPGEVAYFAEIAEAGGGRAVGLARDASLVGEIVGLTIGDRFAPEVEHFFEGWQALCR